MTDLSQEGKSKEPKSRPKKGNGAVTKRRRPAGQRRSARHGPPQQTSNKKSRRGRAGRDRSQSPRQRPDPDRRRRPRKGSDDEWGPDQDDSDNSDSGAGSEKGQDAVDNDEASSDEDSVEDADDEAAQQEAKAWLAECHAKEQRQARLARGETLEDDIHDDDDDTEMSSIKAAKGSTLAAMLPKPRLLPTLAATVPLLSGRPLRDGVCRCCTVSLLALPLSPLLLLCCCVRFGSRQRT